MAKYDFSAPRLFVETRLEEGAVVPLARPAAHYLLSVLRLGAGREVLVFNGRDGEWRAALEPAGRRDATLRVSIRTRDQTATPSVLLLFAPLKHARLDYVVQKAVEMGAGTIGPVLTRRTVATRVNGERMRANAVEAAEQCGILSLPAILADAPLTEALASLRADDLLVFCDEDAPDADPIKALRDAPDANRTVLLIGPEGGFDQEERAAILARERVCRISLGPRILRADTAAVAALALVQAVRGDGSGAAPGGDRCSPEPVEL